MNREHRRAVVRAAPALPDTMPPTITRGKPRYVDMVKPYVDTVFNGDEEFRKYVGSLNPETSPSGRLCFDDAYAAKKIKTAIDENGSNALLAALSPADLWFYVIYALRRSGIWRTQRIQAGEANLLAGQPAE